VTRKGVGVIYVTHRLGEVFRLAQRVTVLRDGRDVETFNAAESDIPSLVRAIVGPKASDTVAAPTSENLEILRNDDPPVTVELSGVSNDRLDQVDLTVRAGEILGLAGMIGSGRTEILETIFGLRRVRKGRMALNGRPVSFRSPIDAIRAGVALVPEDRHKQGLVLDHSIERNISMARLPGLSRFGLFRRKLASRRAGEAMTDLSIKAPAIDTPARALSGGNQQKVVFGKWRNPTPDVLLLDEPTVGVDVGAREQIYALVRDAARQGSAVVVVSSDLGELAMLCDSVAIVARGGIKARLSRAEFGGEERLHHLVQEHQG
jgi:ribose transport system ATP-binding protein